MRHLKLYVPALILASFFFQWNGTLNADAGANGYYSIHNGSYREKKNAESYRASIEKTGMPAFIEKVDLENKGIWYRVYIGRYDTVENARKAVISLKKDNVHDLGFVKKFSAKQRQTVVSGGKTAKAVAPGTGDSKKEKKQQTQAAKPQPAKKAPATQTPVNASATKDPIKKGITNEPLKVPPESADNDGIGPVAGVGKTEKKPAVIPPGLMEAKESFDAERYSEAVNRLDAFIGRENPDKQAVETADRMKAESLYRIGIKGDSQELLKAVDHSKSIIKSYPDPAGGNDLIYCRMARSYEKLNFFYEAAAAWEGLVAGYPDSKYFEEALFRSGYILISAGKKEKAYERLSRYIHQYPNGIYAKKAYYTLGDILYQMQRYVQAGRWFDLVRKKWPDLSDIPETVLYNMGGYYFKVARYDDAFEIFSFLINLCPDDDFGKNSLFLLAETAEKNKELFLALKLYAAFIAKFPESKEATESALAMANLGVERPGIQVAEHIWPMDNYLNPLRTYEKILAKGEGDIERIIFLQAKALMKNGNFTGALNQFLTVLKKYPLGKLNKEVVHYFKKVLAALTDQYYAKGDYKAVGALYFKTADNVRLADDFKTGLKIGNSLQRLGFYKDAAKVFSNYREDANGELAIAVAELDIFLGNTGRAEEKLNLLTKRGLQGDYKKLLQGAREKLADLYFMKGNFDKAAAIYEEVVSNSEQKRDAVFYLHYGRSLQAKKMTQEALKNYKAALDCCGLKGSSCENSVLSRIHMGLGDIYRVQGKFNDGVEMYRTALKYAADEESKKWLMLRIGQTYSGTRDFLLAEKSFSQIKEIPDGEFWPEVADFFISQNTPPTNGEKLNE